MEKKSSTKKKKAIVTEKSYKSEGWVTDDSAETRKRILARNAKMRADREKKLKEKQKSR